MTTCHSSYVDQFLLADLNHFFKSLLNVSSMAAGEEQASALLLTIPTNLH